MKLFGIAGYSGMGKTTLLERLIPTLTARGLVVSLIKHSHKNVDIDRPGKDSWRLRESGCKEVLLLGNERWALMHELRGGREPTLEEQIKLLSPCDLALVEGYKSNDLIPKLEVYRPSIGKPPIHPEHPNIVAVASDAKVATALPVLDINDPDAIVQFIIDHLGLK